MPKKAKVTLHPAYEINASAHPYTQLMRYGRSTSLCTTVDCDTYDIPSYIVDDTNQYYEQEKVDFIDTAAAYNKDEGELTVFVINRNWQDANEIELDLSGLRFSNICVKNRSAGDR